METNTIHFSDSIRQYLPIHEAGRLVPTGRFQWAQRLAWRFLVWEGAIKPVEGNVFKRHVIEGTCFIDRLIKQEIALFDHFNKHGQRLLIGSEDYAELMNSPEVKNHHFCFAAKVNYGDGILGLKIEVIPWMRGAIVMPAHLS